MATKYLNLGLFVPCWFVNGASFTQAGGAVIQSPPLWSMHQAEVFASRLDPGDDIISFEIAKAYTTIGQWYDYYYAMYVLNGDPPYGLM